MSENILDLLRDAETGQRGFVLTGRESYLEPYNAAVQSVSNNMAQLGALSRLGDQSRRLTALQPLITEKLQELRETVELRRASGVAALSYATSGSDVRGKLNGGGEILVVRTGDGSIHLQRL